MLFAMVPYAALATWGNVRNDFVNFKIGWTMEIGSILGVLIGAYFSALFPDLILKTLFVMIAMYLMFTLHLPSDSPYNLVGRGFNRINIFPPFIICQMTLGARCSVPSLIFLGIVAGFFSGLLGIGGGFLNTPVLIVGVLLTPKVAVGTSLFMILITSLVGAAEHAYLHHINYTILPIIMAGMLIGAYIGMHLLKNLPEEKIKRYLIYIMLIASVITLFR